MAFSRSASDIFPSALLSVTGPSVLELSGASLQPGTIKPTDKIIGVIQKNIFICRLLCLCITLAAKAYTACANAVSGQGRKSCDDLELMGSAGKIVCRDLSRVSGGKSTYDFAFICYSLLRYSEFPTSCRKNPEALQH